MSILINGMEMPTGDSMIVAIRPDGMIEDVMGCYVGKAVTVPPHGDLIDRKTAYDSLLDGMVMTGYQSRALDCISEFFVPTIIPADKEET